MSLLAASLRRGWCPTLSRPMDSGDGLLVRVQAPEARLTPEQARALADAAARHGNGVIELTQRGNIQLRGLSPDRLAPFALAMDAAGLVSPTPLLPPPLLGDDPGIDPRAGALVARIAAALAGFALPQKFAVAVDAGGVLGGRPVAADLVATPDGLGLGPGGSALAPAGPLPYADGSAAFALAPPFGQLDPAMLHDAAALAERHATTVRVTPWRALVLGRVRGAVAAGAGWITDPADPRLLLTACIGAPGCARATTRTRDDALRLPPQGPVHVSGCVKGCAHPGPAPRTYVAHDGRYDLVHDGRASDAPRQTGLRW